MWNDANKTAPNVSSQLSLSLQQPPRPQSLPNKKSKPRPYPSTQTGNGPTSILDTGYLEKNIITPHYAAQANLTNVGPSNTLICDANGGVFKATATTRVNRPGLPPEEGNGIITPQAQYSLPPFQGSHNVSTRGCGNLIQRQAGGLRVSWNTGNKFWRVPIEEPQDKMPRKLSIVERLLLSKSPPVLREQVSKAKEKHITCMKSRHSAKASNGCTPYVDTQSNQYRSRQFGQATSLGGQN